VGWCLNSVLVVLGASPIVLEEQREGGQPTRLKLVPPSVSPEY